MQIATWGWLLMVLGAVVIIALAVYAGMLLARLQQQNKRRRQAIDKRNANLLESIVTIAKAMQQEQCPLSEGCLRIVVLLDHMVEQNKPLYSERYPAMHAMYERIKHMPTHEARKQYPKAEIRRMDNEREGYEKELADDIQQDVSKLLEQFR
ncbi:DUF2489 domain-containing protein [Idiomarina xiamenensis]|uniref:DUF2489 domain-containing protein n=1 Tax=Idiomarina xiamenensis 10-D-4 TaxID=740709 RepID=K2K6V7_9GAMM|nr:DUF2489 domain-containing protein [Idiomarina xiamenensis]EKE83398.1 hypothetical protein A10D4_08252 [Idiomarina xiamenensis 10-D-4]